MPRPLRFRSRWSLFPMLFLVLPLGLVTSYLIWFSVVLTPLQQQYLASYMAVPMAARSSRPFPVWWILKTAPQRRSVFAEDADVVPLKHAGRGNLPLALSPQARSEGLDRLTADQANGECGRRGSDPSGAFLWRGEPDATGDPAALRDSSFRSGVPRSAAEVWCPNGA